MKKKFLILTLCFTLIFTSINYKKSYADGGIISLPMLATVSALAVGTGILIKNSDDLYDIGKLFCDYIENQKDLAMSTVQAAFLAGTTLIGDKLSVGGDFLDIVKGFFDNTFSSNGDIEYCGAIPYYPTYSPVNVKGDTLFTYNDMSISILWNTNNYKVVYRQGTDIVKQITLISSLTTHVGFVVESGAIRTHWKKSDGSESSNRTVFSHALPLTGDFSFPYNGGYTWDNVEDKKENDKVALPIPGNLGNLVGQTSDDFWSNTDGLAGNGSLSLPGVSNPSIGVDTTVDSFVGSNVGGGVGSVPNQGIWANIKAFIISLVVPSDAFWVDTWGGLYGSFTSAFPMVDMDNFNKLVTGEKKFPNIDINIMGASGRIVNGDVVNSIVDWLRPIVAGFMMLCLMLFNYRKIYKLIRNSEPFGSVASGNNSDIRTGISEYSKHDVVKATDMVAEYHAWKERGGR